MAKIYDEADLELAAENAFKSIGHLYEVFKDVMDDLSPEASYELSELKKADEFITYLAEAYAGLEF